MGLNSLPEHPCGSASTGDGERMFLVKVSPFQHCLCAASADDNLAKVAKSSKSLSLTPGTEPNDNMLATEVLPASCPELVCSCVYGSQSSLLLRQVAAKCCGFHLSVRFSCCLKLEAVSCGYLCCYSSLFPVLGSLLQRKERLRASLMLILLADEMPGAAVLERSEHCKWRCG